MPLSVRFRILSGLSVFSIGGHMSIAAPEGTPEGHRARIHSEFVRLTPLVLAAVLSWAALHYTAGQTHRRHGSASCGHWCVRGACTLGLVAYRLDERGSAADWLLKCEILTRIFLILTLAFMWQSQGADDGR